MEKISAFMDGESGQAETRQTMLRLRQKDECCDTWTTFHLIGDLMRGETMLRDDFMARFHAQMAHEPTQLAPRMTWRKSASYALSAAASVCAITVVLALVFTDNPLRPQVQTAAAPQTEATTIARADVRPRPVAAANQGKVNEYLMAHQEFSPSNALQGVAPYVRMVSESHDGNGR
jgi:sigma-E factor negative regulatory protein RseA